MLNIAFTVVFGAPLLALALWTVPASAGTVDINCSCNPEGAADNYCTCEASQGLSALATNEFDRYCTVPHADPVRPQDAPVSGPKTMVHDIPSGVTCTNAQTNPTPPLRDVSATYIWNDCTNWSWSKKHVTILTYCWWNGN